MTKTALAILLLAALVLGAAWAVSPQKWAFRSYDDFLRGRFDGVSLTAEGVLSLAPREDKVDGPTEEFYLSFLVALDGSLYVGTGHSGRIFRMGKDGKGELYFQAQEMDVTSLALDPGGRCTPARRRTEKSIKSRPRARERCFLIRPRNTSGT